MMTKIKRRWTQKRGRCAEPASDYRPMSRSCSPRLLLNIANPHTMATKSLSSLVRIWPSILPSSPPTMHLILPPTFRLSESRETGTGVGTGVSTCPFELILLGLHILIHSCVARLLFWPTHGGPTTFRCRVLEVLTSLITPYQDCYQ